MLWLQQVIQACPWLKTGCQRGLYSKAYQRSSSRLSLFTDFPANITIIHDGSAKADFIHYFATHAARLEKDMRALKKHCNRWYALDIVVQEIRKDT